MSIVKEKDDVFCTEKESLFRTEMLIEQHKALIMQNVIRQELIRQAFLSRKDKEVIREQIFVEYENIDYRLSDEENADHFAKIEQKFEKLRTSNLRRSKKNRDKLCAELRNINVSLGHIQRKLNTQIDYIDKTNDCANLEQCEDEIIRCLISTVISLLHTRACCFERDKALARIGIRTFAHKFLSLIQAPQEIDNQDLSPVKKTRPDVSLFKRFVYYVKSWEDKAEYHKAILQDYFARNNSFDPKMDCNTVVQRQLLNDFQGDLAILVREKRKQRKWTQQRLADRSGVERTMIAKVENLQASTSLETAMKLLTALDLGLIIYPLDSIKCAIDLEEKPTTQESIEIEKK